MDGGIWDGGREAVRGGEQQSLGQEAKKAEEEQE